MTTTQLIKTAPATAPVSLLTAFAARFGVDPEKMANTLKATAFKVKDGVVTNEQLLALIVVANEYGLNPFTKEIYAFPDKGGITPVVGVDGWIRIVNDHPQFDGMSFDMADDGSACQCTLYRKDRSHPTQIVEYLEETKRNTEPWRTHPRRMLRHKAFIQAARLAFGFSGIYDPDEGERIRDMGMAQEVAQSSGLASVKGAIAERQASRTVDMATGEISTSSGETTQAPPAQSYAQIADTILRSPTQDEAAIALDLARGLPGTQYDELRVVYLSKWS